MRHITTVNNAPRVSIVYVDGPVNEYVVKFYLNGVHQKDADYFTDEKEDAIATACYWAENGTDNGG